MTDNRWILTDVEQGVFLQDFALSRSQANLSPEAAKWFPDNANWGVSRRTLRGGVSDGVDVIDVNNGKLSFSLLPTRGMGLWQGACAGLELGWKSPIKSPVNPAHINQVDRGGLGWLYGFNELLCRCGLESNGPPGVDIVTNNQGNPVETQLTLHGKIANIPAHLVEVAVDPSGAGKISVTGEVDESMLFGPNYRLKTTYETVIGSNQLTIIDEVTNLKGTPAELELLYHTNFGPPFLEAGAKLVAPLVEVAPRDARAVEGLATYDVYAAPTAGYVEQCYFMELLADKSGATLVMLQNKKGDKAVSLSFNKQELPCFTVWKNTQAEADGYVTGLEPGTNYPNLKTFERNKGRVVMLPPGGSYRTSITLDVHTTSESVAKAQAQIAKLQTAQACIVHAQPIDKYSPL